MPLNGKAVKLLTVKLLINEAIHSGESRLFYLLLRCTT